MQKPLQAADRSVAQLTGLSILLVEDDVLIAMEMEDFLSDCGCRVVGPIGRLDEAIEAVDAQAFDGALVDLNLRGNLSFPLVDRLVERGIPLVLCSGYVDLPEMRGRLEHLPYIKKPCDYGNLAELMVRLFRPQAAQG